MLLTCECGPTKTLFVCIPFVSNAMNNWHLTCCFYFCSFSVNLSFYYFFNSMFKFSIYLFNFFNNKENPQWQHILLKLFTRISQTNIKKYALYIYKLFREIPNTAPTLFVIFDAVIFIPSSKQPISQLKFSRVIRFMQKVMKRDLRA